MEQLPQRWSFQPNAVQIEGEDDSYIYAPEQINFDFIETEDGGKKIVWAKHLLFDDRGRNYIRRLFRGNLRRLYRFQNTLYNLDGSSPVSDVSQHEWDTIRAYYHAIRDALRYAIHSLVNDGDEDAICKPDMSSNEGACDAALVDVYGIHYDDLKDEEDYLNYILPTCSTSQIVEFYNYKDLEQRQTNYQKLGFLERETDNDICMNLESTLQICSNYRPHYHEFFVHFPARFIDTVKRVIFIGGGDSMLLHEVLKYPTLEKVVGLELDQQVTRKSFKYFKSQPHYDNDKVEWWYGDATKSLPLLPADYWGSFDLVLVDLSETVMSLKVTGEMDIFSALSLLLKPEGIMVKNEPYIDQFSGFFDYSIHVFYGSPKICTQVLVMGSNKVDFMHHPTKEHGIERVLLEPLDDNKWDRYKYMHDYRKTDARIQGKCNDHDDDNSTSTEHGRKAGILEILEAEYTSVSLTSELESIIRAVVKSQGLTAISKPSKDDAAIVVLVMKEGYIVARRNPELNHVAFDVNLWGAFPKMESLRSALIKAVGSTSSSFFRIVVGGMHGSSTWEQDQEAIGVRVSQTRNCVVEAPQEPIDDGTMEEDAMKLALGNSVQLVSSKNNLVAVVLCGFEKEDQGKCLSATVLSNHARVSKFVPFWACPELKSHDADSLDFETMYKCERKMLDKLEAVFDDDEDEIDLFVVDASAPYEMLQIFNSIWSFPPNREAYLPEQHVFVSLLTGKKETWRRNFLERHRQVNQFFPVSKAEVTMTAGDSLNIELSVLSVDDRHFFSHLKSLEDQLRESLPQFEVEVKTVTGGIHYYDSEYNEREFEPEAYDAQPALAQAAEQKALGRQSIFQFEYMGDEDEDDETHDTATMPTMEELRLYLEKTQEQLEIVPTRSDTYTDVGDGAVIVSVFAKGGAILVWDGLHHVDINLFTVNQTREYADSFVDTFAEMSSLQKTLRDEHPRGTGRVVQFEYETMHESNRAAS